MDRQSGWALSKPCNDGDAVTRANLELLPPGDVRIAAVDVGSNSVRQIVADVSPTGQIRVVDEMKAMPRLGEGLEKSGRLSDSSIAAAVAAISRMTTLARQLDVLRIEVVATSAVRDAANGLEFVSRVREQAGVEVRLLSGEEEALLCFRSALAHFELGAGRSVVMDIGGGSLEVVLAKDGLIERVASLPFGAVRLTERFLTPQVRVRGVRALREHVREGLRETLPAKDWRGAQTIGSGGTFTNLAGIVMSRQGFTVKSPHGTRVSRVELEHALDWLQRLDSNERANVPGLTPARSDIIVAGLAVAAEVVARFDPHEILVSAFGIREGLLLESARVQPVVADPGSGRERSVREFAERCHYEEPHARTVQLLSLQLFDALGPRMGLADSDRKVLADAALLHDVGYHINYENHHKHSFHLISHADLLGMTPTEKLLVAHVARYHRGASPKRKHRNYSNLDRALRKRIVKLAALLRLADGFDRGHIGAVARLDVRWTSEAVRIAVVPREGATNVRLECWGASRKRALLEEELGREIELVAPDGKVFSPGDDDLD